MGQHRQRRNKTLSFQPDWGMLMLPFLSKMNCRLPTMIISFGPSIRKIQDKLTGYPCFYVVGKEMKPITLKMGELDRR